MADYEEQFEMIKAGFIMQFGENDGNRLFELQKKIMEIAEGGADEENMQRLREAQEKFNALFEEINAKITAHSNEEDDSDDYDEDDEEYDDDVEPVGINAINEAVEELYGEQEGFCFGTAIPYSLGGNDPLDMICIFESESGGIPHWHYITYGFTELYEKESDDEDVSGYGFELTFRLKKNEDEPPKWPVNLLQNIARYVFQTGNVFAPGHHMNANGPIQLGYDTDITALAFISDPELPAIQTENGDVEFIEMVGITDDEMEAVMCWDCRKLIDVFGAFIPLGITDLDRKSFMTNETVQEAFRRGIDVDGSSTSYIYTDFIAVSITEDGNTEIYGSDVKDEELAGYDECRPTIYLGAAHAPKVAIMLRGRLLKNREFLISGKCNSVMFKLGDKCAVMSDDDGREDDILVILTREAVDELTEKLQPKAGEYRLESGNINFKVLKTQITDADGNIVETIG